MAKSAELDNDLINGLKVAKSKRAYFALVLKGGSDGALIVSKAKVPPAAIAEAKKQSGGSAVLKGVCQYEEGTYVFETAKQAPATAAQAVKVIAKRDAGLALKAEFRVSADPELAADEGDSSAATPPTAPPPAPAPADNTAVVKRLNAMTADIKVGLVGPNKDRVKALFTAVNGQIQSKDFAQASKTLDELVPLLKPSAGNAVKGAAAKTDAATPPDGAAIVKRFNAMTADIKAGLAGPNKDRIKTLFVAVNGQLQSKDFTQASKTLDELAPLIAKGADAGSAMAAWQGARKAAVAKLTAIGAEVAKAKHPRSDKALLRLKAVAANLPAEPNTPQLVSETVRYLQQDEVVLDVCEFAEDIRTPLLGILARMKT